ncbi:MAG: helix-turn-helix transcriptional regulator [Clostridia bacterium]|nr:helix-turn-helix transcriptional regulator [Clostridia bacterium]
MNVTPEEQTKLVVQRIIYMREVMDVPASDLAGSLGMTEEEYLRYEKGEKDIPINLIYKIASALDIDPTELLLGESPKMQIYTVTRRNRGVGVERFKGYSFEALAYNYIGRNKEPMIVSISPSDERPKLVVHGGQEFNYVLKGKIGVIINDKTIELNEGDSIYFDPSYPHGQIAIDGDALFLTVIDIDDLDKSK